MQVYAKLFATLVKSLTADVLAQHPAAQRPGARVELELPEGATVADLVAALGLPPGQVRIVFINGRSRTLDAPLAPGDEVGLFPPIGGG